MKKKAIEKIPYLTLPAVSQEKEAEYGMSATGTSRAHPRV